MKPLVLFSKTPVLLSLLLATLFLSGVGMPGQISVHAQDAGLMY